MQPDAGPREGTTPRHIPAPETTTNAMLQRNVEDLSREELVDYVKILQARTAPVSKECVSYWEKERARENEREGLKMNDQRQQQQDLNNSSETQTEPSALEHPQEPAQPHIQEGQHFM